MTYDVAIIGAGPAGSWLGRELAQQHYKVAILERSKIAGEPNFSTAGCPLEIMEQFHLPPQALATTCNRIEIVGPATYKEWLFAKDIAVVLDFRKLKQALLQQAEQAGAHVFLGRQVTGIRKSGDTSAVLTTTPDMVCEARIIVDASGPEGVIATQVGLRKKKLKLPSPGLEVILKASSYPEEQARTLSLYLGHGWAPHGYAWIFPMGGPYMKVGIGVYEAQKHRVHDYDRLLDAFQRRIPWLENAEIIEKHGGIVYMSGGLKHHIQENVVAIGDAADHINPLGGEGIRHALQSSAYASQAIVQSLKNNNLGLLKSYDHQWHKYVGWRWFLSRKVSDIIYGLFSDKGWDRFIRLISKLQPPEFIDLVFEYRYRLFLKAFFRCRT